LPALCCCIIVIIDTSILIIIHSVNVDVIIFFLFASVKIILLQSAITRKILEIKLRLNLHFL
jgi:hypothetical protein